MICSICKQSANNVLTFNGENYVTKVEHEALNCAGRILCDKCLQDIKEKIDFVTKCGELLVIAKPHLIKCQFIFGTDINTFFASSNDKKVMPDDEYVLITCENGCTYKICIEANSIIATANAIFSSMTHK